MKMNHKGHYPEFIKLCVLSIVSVCPLELEFNHKVHKGMTQSSL